MLSSTRASTFLIAAVVLPLLFLGCREQVAAPTTPDSPFSMFGVLNPGESTQTLLVSPIQSLLYDYPKEIDAEVSAMNLETGETFYWADSVVTGERGQTDHIFTAAFTPEFSSLYRVEVVRSDGTSSSATVRIPDMADLVVRDEFERFIDVYVTGDSLHVAGAEVIYSVRWNPRSPESTTCAFDRASYAMSYTDEIVEGQTGYRIRIDLLNDHERVFELHTQQHPIELGYQRAHGLALVELQIRALVTGARWAPTTDSLSDTDISFPGTSSNVSNGYGRIVAGYHKIQRLTPARSVIASSPFEDYLTRGDSECRSYCCSS